MSKKINDTQAMNVRLPVALHKKLKGAAFWKGVSMNKIIVDALYAELFTEVKNENG